MTDLTTPNLPTTVNNTLQEILAEDSANRLSILSWKSKKIPNALILKFHGNRYLGLLRKDKKGQEYWRYHPLNQQIKQTESQKSDQVKKYEQSNNTTKQSSSNNSEHSD